MTVNEADSSIWNISDIERDSENWTLSSDVNMLNLLQTFSDNLLSNLNTSSRALEELITFSSEVSTKVNNTFNEFNMLSNAQFIESRVYEDDETHDVGSDILPDVKEEDTSDVIGARIKTSVEYGLTVLDAAYSVHGYSANSPDDTVEDVDDDEEIIIEPNDPYTHRSLPYLIGSSEYCTDESVGITLLYQSDDESNKSEDEEDDDEDEDEEEEEEEEDLNLPKPQTAAQVLESGEDSDSEVETEVRPAAGVAVPRQPQLPNLRVPSSSESEEMFPETKSARTKVFDSIFDSTDEESEEEEIKPPAPTLSNLSTSNSTTVTREERSPSVLSVKSNKTPKGVPKGAISIFGGRTVFEGGAIKVIEDEESGEEETSAPLADPGSEDDEIRPPKTATAKKVKKIDSIFSDTDESDSEGLFATKNIQDDGKEKNPVVSSTTKKTKSVPQKQAAVKPGSLFDFTDDEEDDMQPKKPMTPRSAGPSKESSSKGAPKAANFDLFDSNESDDGLQDEVKPAPAAQKKSNPPPPKKEEKGLFDSSDEETDTSLFGSVRVLPTPGKKLPDPKKEAPQKKENAKKEDSFDQLFASSDDESSSPHLSSAPSTSNSSKPSNNSSTNKTSDKPTARTAKFDDIFGDSDDDDDDDTFGFSAAPPKTEKSKSVLEQPSVTDNNKKGVPKTSEQKAPAKTKADQFDDLFADSDDESEDIFSSTEKNKNKQNTQPEPANTLKDEPKKDDSKETAGKQTSSKKQEETSTNSQTDKLKARAAKFDDIFGDSDDDDMFTTPAKPVDKIAVKEAVPQPAPEIIEREVPPLEPENKAEKAANKLKQRAAKFDDLFADSDDEDGDIFSSQPSKSNVAPSEPVSALTDKEVKNGNKPPISGVDSANQPPTDKIKARSAKFDDLFADSDEDDDIFADKNVVDSQETEPGTKIKTSEPDILAANNKSVDISTSEVDAGTRSPEMKSSSQSNIAKLQNNLNLSPDMLMGGPRPRKPKNTENSSDETDKVGSEKINKDETPKVDKFGDLFGESDDEDDIFAEKTKKPPKAKDEEPPVSDVPKIESPSNPLFDSDSSPTIPESNTPKSNVAKLQSNLNISPEMLMGGPRPKKPEEPETIEKPKSETKTKARAAKFDNLFDGSDEEDMFSVPELPKSKDKPEISNTNTKPDLTQPSSPEKVSDSNNEDKIKQRAAKFDDLFNESDEDNEDIFSAEGKKNSHPILSEEATKEPESSVQPAVEPDCGQIPQKSKASPNSNIAKLQNNLKFNPAMLMGGPRPPIHKQKEPTTENVSEANKPTNGDQETEKNNAEPQNPKVLSSITKGRTKRGGRRPPSRAPTRTVTSSEPTPAPSQPTEERDSNDQSVFLADSIPTLTTTAQSDNSKKQEDNLAESRKPVIEEEDIFETPSLKFEDEDDIFATPSKTKPSQQKITAIEDDDLFSALPEKKSSILKDDPGEEDDLFSAPSKKKSNVSTTSSSKVKENKEEEDELFSAPAKSRDQRKKKGKTKKILDDDLFGDDFDLFSDISAKPKQSKKDKKGTKAKKSESKDFIDPLFQ